MSESFTMLQALHSVGFLLHPIKGNSMMPLLDEQTDVVKLVPLPERPLRRYEIPLYRSPNGAFVLHRILDVKDGHYVICGDNRAEREYVPQEWIVALAVGRYRGGDFLSFDDEAYLREVRRFWRRRDGLSGRLHAPVRRLFPKASAMKERYAAVARRPWLLPVFYFVRLICAPFRRKNQS